MAISEPLIDTYYLTITLLVTIGMQLAMFAVAWTFHFDKVTDISGSMNFVFIAWLVYWAQGTAHTRQIVCLILVTVWAFRLGGFLLYRVLKRGKDERFDEMRDSFGKFLGFWIFQMVWVWVVSLPVVMLQACTVDAPLTSTDYAGWACFGVGFLCESWADFSKNHFADQPENRGKFLNSDIWSVSRHPNYFVRPHAHVPHTACTRGTQRPFVLLVWIGFYLMGTAAFAVNSDWLHFSVISPGFTFLLLMCVSGIPMGEDRYDKKYGSDPAYREYKRTTAPLIPTPTALYGALPPSVKLAFCCEFPWYSSALNAKPAAAPAAAAGAATPASAPVSGSSDAAVAPSAVSSSVVIHVPVNAAATQ